jgi:hypothetical protein
MDKTHLLSTGCVLYAEAGLPFFPAASIRLGFKGHG